MTPIHELLARVRWDPEFGTARFVIGYYDRVARAQVKVPLERIWFEPGAGFAFERAAEDGTRHSVPYHRVRNVWRNGELIWHRDAPPA
ncbi:MAG: DUF504 domain-containing protein [Rhodoferax sp.]|uniref:DUF504 domain-containing protein n=1 Tax=Rhodoferax sp. TaxID=50421 RepID=UPI0013FFA610|nr:DUF504 domain-containing protein [Rhodoferax sp.]NDP38105.1 DUF504 domain-containing protein [Rhodoferax sp.]